jgi:transcriptional regulator GlxA family with amidase domain
VDCRSDRFTVSDARLTSGGATPAIEMMLHIISARHGAGFAARVAGLFLYDGAASMARPQSRLGGHKHNALTAKANALMEAALDDPMPLARIAESLGTSPRSLQQQFRLRLNTTPQDHYLQLRLAEARRLVTDTDLPLMDVAMATGFTSQSSFARAFRLAHGSSARDLRQERNETQSTAYSTADHAAQDHRPTTH